MVVDEVELGSGWVMATKEMGGGAERREEWREMQVEGGGCGGGVADQVTVHITRGGGPSGGSSR